MQISKSISLDQYLVLFATFLSTIVVLLGAFCRLADAGLGCPDWPGCYGHLISVPQTISEVKAASASYPTMPPLSPERMWPEMIHRYFAGTLGLIIFFLLGKSYFTNNIQLKSCLKLFATLALLVIFQAVLGMWTVTWKLHPLVVMSHLLGGFLITSILWWNTLKCWLSGINFKTTKNVKKIVWAMTLLVFLQILLGGWTSSNYAALICPDFPFCNNESILKMNFTEGFNFFQIIGVNYEFGLLSEYARVAIHMTHRFGAIVVTGFVIYASFSLIKNSNEKYLNRLVYWVLFVLSTQIILGILNIKLILPINVAVAHNGVGLLLLLSCVSLCYFIRSK